MKFNFRVAFIILMMFLILIPVMAGAEEITPDEYGVYNYEYTGNPNAEYLILVLDGLYQTDETPVITDDTVLYYNQLKANSEGKLNFSFIPGSYSDATMFIGAGGLALPEQVCYVMQGDAKNVGSIEIAFDKASYTVAGNGMSVNVNYTVTTKDSYGYDSKLPDTAVYALNYTGDKISHTPGSGTIILDSKLEAGIYSLTVTCGDVSDTEYFEVNRVAGTPERISVTVDGTAGENHYIICKNNADGGVFDPQSVLIDAKLYDQYDSEVTTDFTIMCTKVNESGAAGTEYKLHDGASPYTFVPDSKVASGKSVVYELVIRSKNYPAFATDMSIHVTGQNAYTGLAERLYTVYAKALGYYNRIENGDIVEITANDSINNYVHTQICILTADKQTLYSAIDRVKPIFRKLDAGEDVSGVNFDEECQIMTSVVDTFERRLLSGGYVIIESFNGFKNGAKFYVPVGGSASNPVNAMPVNPAPVEKPRYTSSDTTVATVDANGMVTAVSEGTAVITASNTDGSISAYYDLTVYTAITSMEFAEKNIVLAKGEMLNAAVTVLPQVHSDTVKYTSSNSAAVLIDSAGMITARNKGESFITAQTIGNLTARANVTVVTPEINANTGILAKPTGRVTIVLSGKEMVGISEMQITATYDPAVFSFVQATDSGRIGGYVDTDTTQNSSGKVISSWQNNTAKKRENGVLMSYTFDIKEGAVYNDYRIYFKVTAKSAGGNSIGFYNDNVYSTVTVAEKDTYTVTVTANNGGSAAGGGEFHYGETATATAYPDSTHDFYDWVQNGVSVSTNAEYSFDVTENITVTARFTLKQLGGGGGGSGGGGGGGGGFGGGGGGSSEIKQIAAITSSLKNGSTVEYGTTVKLSTVTPDVFIYYTTDGTTPAASNGTLYKEPILLDKPQITIRAIAVASGMKASDIANFNYKVTNIPEEKPEDKTEETPEENTGASTAVSIKLKSGASTIKYVNVSSKYFRPNDSATRYNVVAMLSKLFDVSGGTSDKVLTDVHDSYKELVNSYVKAGILNGYPDGTFGGAKGITRAEFVKVVGVMLKLDFTQIQNTQSTLSDISGHWAENYIKAFVAHGYIQGYPEGDFRPDKAVTRAEAVAILNRVAGTVKTTGLAQYFNDVKPNFWAYDDIMSAANIK